MANRPADNEPRYCGFCIAALDHERCPACGAIWVPISQLTEWEARTFKTAYDADGDSADDIRWGNAWLAVDRMRSALRVVH